jgi:endonuclease-3 related protein
MCRLAEASTRTIEACIYPTGFYRQKARRIKNIADYLFKRTRGNLNIFLNKPMKESRDELLALDGIGKETADSILLYAGNQLILPIDAYTLRVVRRVEGRKGSYDSMQSYLQRTLPDELDVYQEFHALVVEHAKRTCVSTMPKCLDCEINSCLYRLKRHVHRSR